MTPHPEIHRMENPMADHRQTPIELDDEADHYPECNEERKRGERCRCDYINQEIDDWYTEPSDMFAREWGC